MKIEINKNLVDFKPGNEQEVAELEKLWRLLVSCTSTSKNLVPVGAYVPGQNDAASFYIEGLDEEEAKTDKDAEATESFCCTICNKYIFLKPGETAPLCCGIPMKRID